MIMQVVWTALGVSLAFWGAVKFITPSGTERALDIWSNTLLGLNSNAHGGFVVILFVALLMAIALVWWSSWRARIHSKDKS